MGRFSRVEGCPWLCTRAPARSYDLTDRRQRARVYEQVLVESGEQDVRQIIDVDDLITLWDELILPDHVRRAWADTIATMVAAVERMPGEAWLGPHPRRSPSPLLSDHRHQPHPTGRRPP